MFWGDWLRQLDEAEDAGSKGKEKTIRRTLVFDSESPIRIHHQVERRSNNQNYGRRTVASAEDREGDEGNNRNYYDGDRNYEVGNANQEVQKGYQVQDESASQGDELSFNTGCAVLLTW